MVSVHRTGENILSYANTMAADEQLATLQAAVQILLGWGLTQSRSAHLLDVDIQQLEGCSAAPESQRVFTDDQLHRADLVIGFGEIIGALFENPKNLREFASRPNKNAGFDGRSLLEVLESSEAAEWQRVFRIFKAQTMNPW